MADEIRPALTADEWKERSAIRNGCRVAWVGDGIITARNVLQPGTATVLSRECNSAIIALANAALPDDDPRKITREDVAVLERMIRGLDTDHAWLRGEDQSSGATLAAKLSALLPPA